MRDFNVGATEKNGATMKRNRSTVSWGPELQMPPSPAQAARDALLLRGVMNNGARAAYGKKLTAGSAADLATEDIAAISEIKDPAMRKQAMVSARISRQESLDYKTEFTRLAPPLARAVDATPSLTSVLSQLTPPAPVPVTLIDPTALLKIKAFLYSDPEVSVSQYPDLAPGYGLVYAARKFAERNLPGHEQKFVDLAIDEVVGKIERGEPIPDPGINARVKDRRDVRLTRAVGPQRIR